MLGKIVLLFVLLPLVDLLLLLYVSSVIGIWETLALVVLTGVLGGLLARFQGVQTLRRLRFRLSRRESPSDELIDGALVLVGAALLVTPGLITDAVGLLLLLPFTRPWLRRRLRSYLRGRVVVRRFGGPGGPGAAPRGGPDGPSAPGGGYDASDGTGDPHGQGPGAPEGQDVDDASEPHDLPGEADDFDDEPRR